MVVDRREKKGGEEGHRGAETTQRDRKKSEKRGRRGNLQKFAPKQKPDDDTFEKTAF